MADYKKAKLVLDQEYVIGTTDKRLFGAFIEHLGRAIYGGIYEPAHPLADEDGFRRDVLELVRELRVGRPLPGRQFRLRVQLGRRGGPQEQRPVRLELAWG